MQLARAPRGVMAALFSIMVVVTITVVIQNPDAVRATVFFRTITVPLALLLILILASGMLSGAVLYRALSHNRLRK